MISFARDAAISWPRRNAGLILDYENRNGRSELQNNAAGLGKGARFRGSFATLSLRGG
jgi:hypothetical protein